MPQYTVPNTSVQYVRLATEARHLMTQLTDHIESHEPETSDAGYVTAVEVHRMAVIVGQLEAALSVARGEAK